MPFDVKLNWKAFYRLPDSTTKYVAGALTDFFDVRTGKSLLREIGGDIDSGFFPLVLEPRGRFFTELAPISRRHGLTNSKTVFLGSVPHEVWPGLAPLKIKFGIHTYDRHVCITVECSSFEVGSSANIAVAQDILAYPAIAAIVQKIIEVAASGAVANDQISSAWKVFPCIQIAASPEDSELTSSQLVEIITRHPRANNAMVDEMFGKNKNHQIDGTTTLLDRQGLVSYLPGAAYPDERAGSDRRFRSCSAMIELAAAAQRVLRDIDAPSSDVIAGLSRLIQDPLEAIPNSTSAQRAWLLLSKEFSLASLFSRVSVSSGSSRAPACDGSNGSNATLVLKSDRLKTQSSTRESTSVLCIAAATVELKAIYSHLEEEFGSARTIPIDDGRDYLQRFFDEKNSVTWDLVSLSFQGETEAAVEVKGLCSSLKPTIVLMIGMCMSMPTKALPLGTVVIPNEVVVFDHTRHTVEGVQQRPHGDRVDNEMFRLARHVSIKRKFPFDVVADKGLASATIKVENAKTHLVEFIGTSFPDAVAYDMEGWGFYRAGAGQRCLWIKAVADSGESQASNFSHQADKKKLQSEVTRNAVTFAFYLVEEFVDAHRLGTP